MDLKEEQIGVERIGTEKKMMQIPGRLRLVRLPEALSLAGIAESGQCFRASVSGELPGIPGQGRPVYRFVTGTEILYCAQEGARALLVSADPETWRAIWAPYFDLDREYRKIEEAFLRYIGQEEPAQLPWLTEVIREGRGIRILRQDPWEMLSTFLISQRKSIPAIRRAVELLCVRYGEETAAAAGTSCCAPVHLFPSPEAILLAGADGLRECGIGYRVPYLLDAAQKTAAGELAPAALAELSDEALLTRLLSVYGVGKKVADCVMLFGYGRVQRAPEDIWVRRIREQRFSGRDPFPAWNAAGIPAGIIQQYLFSHAVHHRAAYKDRTDS